MTHYTENCSRNIAISPVGPADALLHAFRQWLKTQRLRAAIQRERASLATMSDAMLADIGIDRATAEQEAERNDIPESRRL
jgi:uncharacterized protein YjiS (DUF1127 family)